MVSALHAHLVFVTKYRRGVLDDGMLTFCEEVTRKLCSDFDAELREFNGEADHVHLLRRLVRRRTLSIIKQYIEQQPRP